MKSTLILEVFLVSDHLFDDLGRARIEAIHSVDFFNCNLRSEPSVHKPLDALPHIIPPRILLGYFLACIFLLGCELLGWFHPVCADLVLSPKHLQRSWGVAQLSWLDDFLQLMVVCGPLGQRLHDQPRIRLLCALSEKRPLNCASVASDIVVQGFKILAAIVLQLANGSL